MPVATHSDVTTSSASTAPAWDVFERPATSSGIWLREGALEPTVRRGPGRYDRRKGTDERHREQRDALVGAAAHVFARDGFAHASVAAIADYAQLSRGTFYRHFRDLSDIFLAVRRSAVALAYERVSARVAAEIDPLERLRSGLRAWLELLAEHGDLARVFLREAPAEGRAHERLHREALDRFVGLVQEGLTAAHRQGFVKKVPSEPMVRAVLLAIEGMAIHYLETYEESRAVESEPVLLRLCIRAFR